MLWETGTMILKNTKNIDFLEKNVSRITPLDPTERYKHVQTMLQLMYYCKNTGCITKNALGDGYDDFVKHEKMDFSKK